MIEEKVIIVGSSGHSKVVIDIFEKEGRYQILGLIDSFREIGQETLGYKVIGSEEDLQTLLEKNPNCKLFIAIGDNWIRKNVKDKIISIIPNADFATAIHPSAQIGKDVQIGNGTAIMAGAIINSSSNIGDFVIINTNASIDHDCNMLNFSSLAPNATLGGRVSIGEFSAISIGATLKHGVFVGKHSVIGAGALLMENCLDLSIMYGVPAVEVRKREKGENYL